MIYTKKLTSNPKSVEQDLYKIEKENPVSVQLIGNDKEALIKSIDLLESYRFSVLDINAGCPSKRALKAKEGGYLLKNLKILEQILKTAVKHSSRPVSLKTRIGFNNSKNLTNLANIINSTGIDFTTIHARCVKSRFDKNFLDLDSLRELRKIITVPLVGNGDINNPIFAKYFIDYTDVDALMIGRGTMGNPELFYQINEYLTKGIEIFQKNGIRLMKKHIEIFEDLLDEFIEGFKLDYSPEEYKFKELQRNSIWLSKDIKDSTNIRRKISKTKNLKQLRIILKNIYENYKLI